MMDYKFISVLLLVGFMALVPFNPPHAMLVGHPQYRGGYDGPEYSGGRYYVYNGSNPFYKYYYFPSYGYYYPYPDSNYFPRHWGPYYDTYYYPYDDFWNPGLEIVFGWGW